MANNKIYINSDNYLAYHSQGVGKAMADSSHTLTSSLSMLRSSLDAGKKQPRVWQQYVCGVTETLLYPSFGAPLLLLCSPYGDSKMAWRCVGDPAEVYALGNIGGVANEAGFNGSRTYVQGG